jgi:excisionase family DNA binding protein
MPSNMVSTQEVADMLHVTETTIKRWADETILPCVRTPGGHRKFLLTEIVRYAERYGYTIGGSHPPALTGKQLEQLELGVHTRNYARIAGVFREEALQADRDGMLKLFLYLYKQQIPFTVIVDEVVRPAFEVIGAEWEEGRLEVNQEHAASQATMESLILLSSELHRKGPNGLSALCACPEGEFHEIGLRGLAYSLECEGWRVHYIGANTPVETLTSFIQVTRPNLVCLSVTTGRHRGELVEKLKRLASLVHSYDGKMIFGGYYAAKLNEKDIKYDHIARSIQDALAYSRDAFSLKPGPKKKSERKDKLHH